MQKISLLIVSSHTGDEDNLKDLLRETPWEFTVVPHIDDAAAALKAAVVPIILLDRDTAGSCWQSALSRLVKFRRNACVVLLSNVADPYLWDEVVRNGGFDLLTRPFRKEQVLSVLVFAYAHSRTPWPKAVS